LDEHTTQGLRNREKSADEQGQAPIPPPVSSGPEESAAVDGGETPSYAEHTRGHDSYEVSIEQVGMNDIRPRSSHVTTERHSKAE